MLFQTFLRKSRSCQEICFRTFSSSSSKNDGQNLFPDFLPRTSFELPPNYARIDWHPKHMGLQMKIMEGKLRTVDLILEVHDARVAITGRNPNFGSRLYAIRPHILILNKKDLIDLDRYREPIENHYRNAGIENIFWTDCTKRVDPQWDRLRRKMLELLQGEHRFNRTVKTEYQVMVVGIPNVGKSSLINSLRKNNLGLEKASAEGALPGVTIRVQNRVRIWDRPPIYILDTPGVLNPWIHTMEEAMKLAACNLILGSTTKPHFLADFLLYYFNKYRDFSYVNLLKMNGPSDEIDQLLLHHCKLNDLCVKPSELAFMNKMNKTNQIWDRSAATTQFLQLFTRGKIVDKFLDRDLLGFHDSSTNNPTRIEGEKIERRKRRHSPD